MYKFRHELFQTNKSKLHLHSFLKKFNKFFSRKNKLDPYLILELSRNSDWKAIKKQYFKLARLYHPDLNKDDERANKKFLQIKDAYEYFERRYNPGKYENTRTIHSKFDDAMEDAENGEKKSKTGFDEENFESIRETKNKSHPRKDKGEKTFKHDDKSFTLNTEPDATTDFLKREQLNQELKNKEYIDKFLFTKTAVPRSYRMIDRLGLKQMTLSKGKPFGPEDYMGFTILTFFILYVIYSRSWEYKTYTFENMQNINIYNALKPSEVVKIYEDNEISPQEQITLETKEHKKFSEEKVLQETIKKAYDKVLFGVVSDVPKADLKKQFNQSIKEEEKVTRNIKKE
jgi:curved DNA-binding protein CbpA